MNIYDVGYDVNWGPGWIGQAIGNSEEEAKENFKKVFPEETPDVFWCVSNIIKETKKYDYCVDKKAWHRLEIDKFCYEIPEEFKSAYAEKLKKYNVWENIDSIFLKEIIYIYGETEFYFWPKSSGGCYLLKKEDLPKEDYKSWKKFYK